MPSDALSKLYYHALKPTIMSSATHWGLLYLLLLLLIIFSYSLTKMILDFRQRIIGKPTYPLVKAFSVLLIAFTLQNGLSRLLFTIAMDLLGYEDYVYAGNPHGTAIFYIVVGAVAIVYALSLRGGGNDEESE